MSKKSNMFKEVTQFGKYKYIAFILLGITSLFIAKYLKPEIFGIYGALLLIMNYSQYSHLGINSAFTKKASYYISKEDTKSFSKLKNNVFTTIIGIVLFLGAIMYIASIFLQEKYSELIIGGLRFMILLVMIQQIYFFYTLYVRAEKRFSTINMMNILHAAFKLLSVVVCMYFWGLYGVLIAIFLTHVISVLYIQAKEKYAFSFEFDFKYVISLIRFGFPFYIFQFLYIILPSIDKLMVITFFSSTDVGYYSLASLVLEFVLLIPFSFVYVLLPYQIEKFSRDGAAKVRPILKKALSLISLGLPIVIGTGIILIEPFINMFIPDYIPAIYLVQILLLASFFLSIMYITMSFLISINKDKILAAVLLVLIGISAILDYVVIQKGYALVGIAYATLAITIVGSIIFMLIALSRVMKSRISVIKNSCLTLLPIVFISIVTYYLNILFSEVDIKIVALKVLIYLVAIIPLIYLLNKKQKIIELILG